ncbi:uncharacterized protein ALTATR162_LOCUS7834 [Alternaria atra]|uniref:Rhodopsin domain-containing protein n=1 Tax=Alternaria atra TaxID=119953 RepID=A0A8J2IBQ3_9PLEO|nr:uncharacterized protein ALTATR162_LOCUS7834 [Alternaria atra]CAG5174661.1 unnamed protein product [Alternaria atra]
MTYFGDKAPEVTATVTTLAAIAYVVFGMRVYTRIRNRAWGMDDWCMTVATIPFTALTVSCLGGSFKGVGVHEFRLSAEQKTEGLKFFFFFEVFYCAAIIPIKLSISFMLVRIASGKKKYIHSLYAVSAMFTVMNFIALFYIIFHCSPVQYAWNTSIPGGSCNPAKVLADIYYATTVVNITTDWFCAILPIPLLWNVQLNRNAKLSVGVILSLGALASLSACIRLVYTVNLTHSTDFLSAAKQLLRQLEEVKSAEGHDERAHGRPRPRSTSSKRSTSKSDFLAKLKAIAKELDGHIANLERQETHETEGHEPEGHEPEEREAETQEWETHEQDGSALPSQGHVAG